MRRANTVSSRWTAAATSVSSDTGTTPPLSCMMQLAKLHSTTLEDDDAMSAHASAPTPPATRTVLRHVLSHLLVPVLLATGMALAYLGGFHQPDPHGVRVDVVGTDR